MCADFVVLGYNLKEAYAGVNKRVSSKTDNIENKFAWSLTLYGIVYTTRPARESRIRELR